MCVKQDILAALSYFDIFDYPLTQTEIFQYLRSTYPLRSVQEGLQELTMENWIFKFDEFYSLQDNYGLIGRRRQGNIRARALLETAEKVARFLSAFPFVKGVAVSGSLSKNFADEQSDIDLFIITAKNRLWIARTLMHCCKKISFLFKKQDWFCMNYYVDEEALRIKEKNVYTAVEVATLLPLRGIAPFQEFYARNKWTRYYLPNHTMRISYVKPAWNPWLKRLVEIVWNHPLGDLLDYLLMKYTAYRWGIKTKKNKLNKRGVVMSMTATRHCAKPDPRNFQNKLIELYEKKIVNLFRRYETRAKSIF